MTTKDDTKRPDDAEIERQAIAAMRRFPLFTELEEGTLLPLARQAHWRRCAAGARIVEQADTGTAAFFILSGRVNVVLESPGGGQFILTQLGAGDHFGEMALLDAEPRSASCVAVETTDVLILRREPFLAELERSPALVRGLLVSLSRRLRVADAQLGTFAFGDTSTRLARLLLERAVEGPDGPYVTLRQEELGEMTGATRQTVGRILGHWRRLGYVRTGHRAIRLLQAGQIAAIAGMSSE